MSAQLKFPRRQFPPEGRRLAALLVVLLTLYALAIVAAYPDVLGARMVIRATARTSLLLFVLAFTASSLARLRPSAATAWLLRNRRVLGLSFAFSHLLHACAIAAFAALDPEGFHAVTALPNYIGGGLGYLFIIAMAATSFDRAVVWLGGRRWTLLHTTGAYAIWLVFVVSEGKRLAQGPFYAAALALLVLALGIRLAARRTRGGEVRKRPSAV
jgi:DMSO/TMAO reductase YedYZ heme-binding membrane subunit